MSTLRKVLAAVVGGAGLVAIAAFGAASVAPVVAHVLVHAGSLTSDTFITW